MNKRSKYRVVPLTTKCLNHLISNVDVYISEFAFLPNNLKNEILKHTNRFTSKSDNFMHEYFTALLNSQTEILDLSSIVCDKEIIKALKICSNLKVLNIGKVECEFKEFASLFYHLPKLKKLHTWCNQYITDYTVDIIAKNCPMLRVLDIRGSVNVTDETLNHIVRNDLNLIAINLSSSQITNEGIIHLVLHKGDLIEDLQLQNCDKITNDAIIAVVKNCPNIQQLLYQHCLNVRTENLDFGRNNLRQLMWTVPWR